MLNAGTAARRVVHMDVGDSARRASPGRTGERVRRRQVTQDNTGRVKRFHCWRLLKSLPAFAVPSSALRPPSPEGRRKQQSSPLPKGEGTAALSRPTHPCPSTTICAPIAARLKLCAAWR